MQCHDYTMMYGYMTLHGLKSVEEYQLLEYNSVLIKGIFEHEQSTFQQQLVKKVVTQNSYNS